MSEYPDSLKRIIQEALEQFKDSIQDGVDFAVGRARKLPEFEALVNSLVRDAIQQLLYDARHASNVRMRKQANEYGQEAKVKTGTSGACQAVARSVYTYFLAGKSLGQFLGEELAPAAQAESERASGHAFNARLLTRLSRMVPEGKRVQEVVKENRLRKIFDEVGRENAA